MFMNLCHIYHAFNIYRSSALMSVLGGEVSNHYDAETG